MSTLRKVIEIDEEKCNGCGVCVPSCEEGAIQIIDGKARLIADKLCDGLGACLGDCPEGALNIVEREADEFDEVAVEAHLAKIEAPVSAPQGGGCPGSQARQFAPQGGGCPGSQAQQFAPPSANAQPGATPSALSQWPVQIRLISPQAPYLDGAHLLVAADCVPVAYGSFHQDMLAGKIVALGCPKFDDLQAYTQKFTDMFSQSNIASVTVVVMQVPCCQGLPHAVKQGMDEAGKDIPMERVVVSLQGEILEQVPF
jgi:NAD-dependent dihydropyrimidine dehydrogenase PreA subunit